VIKAVSTFVAFSHLSVIACHPACASDSDYFDGSDKMICWIMFSVLASNLRFEQYSFEVPPVWIFEHHHEVACRLEFHAIFINLPDALKGRL